MYVFTVNWIKSEHGLISALVLQFWSFGLQDWGGFQLSESGSAGCEPEE